MRKNCVECGRGFNTKKSNVRICSDKCRLARSRRKALESYYNGKGPAAVEELSEAGISRRELEAILSRLADLEAKLNGQGPEVVSERVIYSRPDVLALLLSYANSDPGSDLWELAEAWEVERSVLGRMVAGKNHRPVFDAFVEIYGGTPEELRQVGGV